MLEANVNLQIQKQQKIVREQKRQEGVSVANHKPIYLHEIIGNEQLQCLGIVTETFGFAAAFLDVQKA